MVKRYHKLMIVLFGAVDLSVAVAAWLSGYGLRYLGGHLGLTPHGLPGFGSVVPAMLLSWILMLLIFSHAGLYQPKRARKLPAEIADTCRAVLITWGLTYIIVGLMRQVQISRLLMVSVAASWLVLAALNRLTVRMVLRWFRRRGWNQRTAAIIGTGRLAQKLCHTLRRHIWTGITPAFFVGQADRDRKLLGLEVRGPFDALEQILTSQEVDVAFVALPGEQHAQVAQVLDHLASLNVDVQVAPDLLSFHYLRHDVTQLDNIPLVTLTHSPQHGWNRLLKRVFDILVSITAVVIAALPMLLIALLIKLTSRGPVFYRQVRTSLGGAPFKIIKFRTMRQNSEEQSGPVWASPNDARVTRFGRLLRRSSLDELPQLFNILAGHMSLVGPRPERPELIERFRKEVPRYMLRHQVKAGLAGWAQVHGLRGQTSLRKRIQYDLYYITNWSFGLDLRILLMTPFKGLINPNAY